MVQAHFAPVSRNVYPKTAESTSALSILRNGVRNTFRNVTPTSPLIDFVNSAKVAVDIAKNQLSQLPWNDAVAATRSLLSGRSASGVSSSSRSVPVPAAPVAAAPVAAAPVAAAPAVSPSQPETFDYLDAPWASAYKMSRETAYSEALNNTSYQRAVKDMVNAGLNPAVIFGAGNGHTAGVPAYVSSGSSAFPVSSPSRSSGSGRSKSSDKLFSTSAYSVMSALGGIVGALATKSAGGYWIGTSLTQGAMSALSLLSKGAKKR